MLPEKLSRTLNAARAVAFELQDTDLPSEDSVDFTGLLHSILSCRVRLEKRYPLGSDIRAKNVLYGTDEVIQLEDIPYAGILWLWEDKSVFLVKDRILALDTGWRGWIVYMPEDEVMTELTESMFRDGLQASLNALRMSPQAPRDVISRLEESVRRLNSRPIEVRPSLRSEELLKIIRPWKSVQAGEGEPVWSLFAPLEEHVPEPVAIGGVSISEVHMTADHWFELSQGGLRVAWSPQPSWSTFYVVDEEKLEVYVHAVDDFRYPMAIARFSNSVADRTVDRIIALAEDILRANPDSWPDMRWNERLHSALTALVSRRFWASSELKTMNNSLRLVYEGDNSFAVFSHFTERKDEGLNFLEIKAGAGGFDLYDSFSGSLLNVEHGEGWLDQRGENARKDDEIDFASVAALAELGKKASSILPYGVTEQLDAAVQFARNPDIQGYELYEVEEPRWTNAWDEAHKPAQRDGLYR
jgi:hypothetical protein